MTRLALLTALLLSLPASAELKIAAPAKPVPAYKIVRLKAEGMAEKSGILWRYDKKAFDVEKKGYGPYDLVFVAPPGTYTVEGIAIKVAADGTTTVEETSVEVTVEGEVPPAPVPVPPSPTDPLTLDLKALFQAEPPATRAKDAASLAGIYRAATIIADDAKVTTVGKLNELIAEARKATVADTALVPLRKRIAPELAILGTDANAQLVPLTRDKAKVVFARIATSLEACK